MIRCRKTESLPQSGNDKTTNLRQHTCKVKWDGIYSRDTVSNKSHQRGRSKGTHYEKSTRKINWQEKMVPVWLLRALTYHLKGIPHKAFLPKRGKKALWKGISQQEVKKVAEDALSEADKNFFMLEDSLINDKSDEEWQGWLTALGVSVQKSLGGSGNLRRNYRTGSQRFCVGSKMAWRGK